MQKPVALQGLQAHLGGCKQFKEQLLVTAAEQVWTGNPGRATRCRYQAGAKLRYDRIGYGERG